MSASVTTRRSTTSITFAVLYGVAAVAGILMVFFGPTALPVGSINGILMLALSALHAGWGCALLVPAKSTRRALRRFFFLPEFLLLFALALFLFAYLYALNANMDYVQRFIEAGGNLNLALDTSAERTIAILRYFPFLLVNTATLLFSRLRRRRLLIAVAGSRVNSWTLALSLLSALLVAIALPSFARLDGIGPLAWVAYVPLFVVILRGGFSRVYLGGVTFGLFSTILINYWLGTFSLVSLQFILVFFLIYHVAFIPVLHLLVRRARWAAPLVIAAAWTFFEFARSSGFLGYPWGLAGHTQYDSLRLIQFASITGVWGVSFLVLLVNAAVAAVIVYLMETPAPAAHGWWRLSRPLDRRGRPTRSDRRGKGTTKGSKPKRSRIASSPGSGGTGTPAVRGVRGRLVGSGSFAVSARLQGVARRLAVPGLAVLVALLGGSIAEARLRAELADAQVVRVALIQQNADPRKHSYEHSFEVLTRLTDATLPQRPDLVAWSETAFVPNIRRWSQEDPRRYRLAQLVEEFLDYQQSIGTYLVTGNDDYRLVLDANGDEIDRLNYNAAILFAPDGTRMETYHKMKLVPFTESFPYQRQFPWLYRLLLDFDVNLWEQGEIRTVFEHPMVRFSTPICFEDAFPDEVRRFVPAGAQMFINLSNDYWSLDEVEAKQHFAAGTFRAIENRRPLLRSTASGLTSYVDHTGRLRASVPYYQEEYLVVDAEIPQAVLGENPRMTIYTRFGDWFPWAMLLVAILPAVVGTIVKRRKRIAG